LEAADVVVMLELELLVINIEVIEPEGKPARGNGIHDECQT
jgi:hypothetical protein